MDGTGDWMDDGYSANREEKKMMMEDGIEKESSCNTMY